MAGETTFDARRGLEGVVVAGLGHGVEWRSSLVVVMVVSCWVDSVEWLLAWTTVHEGCVWWHGVSKVRVHGARSRHSENL